MNAVELDHISKSYGDHKVLDDFSLTAEPGDFICVSGESGAGKSTLLNIIGLLEKFDSGDYYIFGKKAPSLNSKAGTELLKNNISYLFQSFALINDKTVEYNLNVGMNFMKLTKTERGEKISRVLSEVRLEENTAYKKINQLSGGEQQRVALARVMLKPSRLILADEPTGSLDGNNRDKVMNILKALNDKGKTIIMVSHDPAAAGYAKRQIYIEKN